MDFTEISKKQGEIIDELFQKFLNSSDNYMCLLSLAVGSGKTIITLKLILRLFESGLLLSNPIAFFLPLSIVDQWISETAKVFKEDKEKPEILFYHGSKRLESLSAFLSTSSKLKFIFTTKETYEYDVFRKKSNPFGKIRFSFMVVDEIHQVRNPKTNTFQALQTVHAKYKLGLSATLAVSDASKDLQNIAGLFGFTLTLKNIVQSHIVSRTKTDMQIREIPRQKNVIFCSFDGKERELYLQSLADMEQKYLIYLQTREHWNFVVRDLAEKAYKVSLSTLVKMSSYPYLQSVKEAVEKQPDFAEQIYRDAPESAKMKKVLEVCATDPRKILIFSSFSTVIKVLKEKLISKGREDVDIICGEMTQKKRAAVLNKVSSGQVNILLLTKGAGGVGLNLAEFTCSIIYDPSFHPSEDEQAIGRMDRLTSTAEKIYISQLKIPGTIDMMTYSVHVQKEEQSRLILDVANKKKTESDLDEMGEFSGTYKACNLSSFIFFDSQWTTICSTFDKEAKRRKEMNKFALEHYEKQKQEKEEEDDDDGGKKVKRPKKGKTGQKKPKKISSKRSEQIAYENLIAMKRKKDEERGINPIKKRKLELATKITLVAKRKETKEAPPPFSLSLTMKKFGLCR